MKYLEQLVREWHEYKGYFVRRDLWVGLEPSDGSYECELDIVAFHPMRRHVVHIETSDDLRNLQDCERHFQAKFDAGKKYLHRIFGSAGHLHIEQIALILESGETQRLTIGAARSSCCRIFWLQSLASCPGSMSPAPWFLNNGRSS